MTIGGDGKPKVVEFGNVNYQIKISFIYSSLLFPHNQ